MVSRLTRLQIVVSCISYDRMQETGERLISPCVDFSDTVHCYFVRSTIYKSPVSKSTTFCVTILMLPFDHRMAADARVTQQAVNRDEKKMNGKLFVEV